MAAATNGYSNGVNGHADHHFERFSQVPAAIDIPVRGEEADEAVNLDLGELLDETDELCDLLENENAACNYWITIALAYAKQNKAGIAIDFLQKALQAHARGRPEDRLSILACICWLNLWMCRRAPRVKPASATGDERTKDVFLQAATTALNEASRMNPAYPPLYLVHGTLHLLRASLQPSKAGSTSEHSDRAETLRAAAKCFDDAYRMSKNKNVMAIIGKAKTQFSLGKYPEAYVLYQQVLERAPDMIDPDPRIGIGCCLWQLGYKNNAHDAWERSLALNPQSKIANILLGLYHLDETSHYSSKDPKFAAAYGKAMTSYVQTAFKLDDMYAITCATFGGYFVGRRKWENVERLARRAIENTDMNAIASDGWYLLARKDHYEGNLQRAQEHYNKADQARGGEEKGYLPAKFGAAQLRTMMQDFDGAKFRLEKIIATNKSVEAMTLLGILNAEDVFASQAAGSKEDKSAELKKAIALLESVRISWKDAKKKITPDPAVLLNLARLYESEQPDKALACLRDVEQMEMDEIADEDLPEAVEDEATRQSMKREMLSPQLLNNIACFHFQSDKLSLAREYFQAALNASVSIRERDETVDTDALVSTISYNLARTYEAQNIDQQAKEIYDGLLERHPDYTDAKARLAFMTFQEDPTKGAEAIKQLMESEPANLELRSLYGWYINKHKKRTLALDQDQEQKHYKHTLLTYDKHDVYSLTAMGNLHLTIAREMPKDTDQHKDRRTKTYMRAVEFFDKVLTLDPKNAFAAQGLGIAVVEEKKDTSAAIQIFTKVRESIKDASVHINLGHVFCDLKQFSRSIENYELALAKSKDKDPHIMACLGRVWLMRGRAEKNFDAFKTSLDYSQQALLAAPANINFKFNVAFVQNQIAQQMIQQPEANKTLVDVEAASVGLDQAIEAFAEIAKSTTPPYPRHDIEQRANMARNTMKRQLATAIEKQTEYEKKNASRLEEAQKRREEAIRKQEEERRAAAEKEEEHRRRIREERERMAEEDRQMALRRLEEEKMREEAEYTTDAETGERKKREKRPKEKRPKRKKKGAEDSDIDDGVLSDGEDGGASGARSRARSLAASAASGSDAEAPRRKKKKRRLERKSTSTKTSSKYKSAETIDSDDDDDDAGISAPVPQSDDIETPGAGSDGGQDETMADGPTGADDDEDEEDAAASRAARGRKPARVLDDEDEDE